jgi:hypothetical protein
VLLLALLFGIGAATLRWMILIDLAIVTFVFAMPLASWFRTPKGWPRLAMGGALVVLAGIAGLHVFRMLEIGGLESRILLSQWEDRQLLGTYAKGILGATILGNILNGVRVQKG